MHSRIFLPCHATQLQLRNAPRASSSIVNIVMSWQCWTYGVWFKKHPGSTQIHIRFGLVSRMFFPMIPYWKHRRQCLGKGSTAWKRHDTCRQLFEKGDLDRGKKELNILLVVFWCVDAHTQESLLGSLGRDSPMDHETNSTSSLPRMILELQKLMPDLLQQYGYVSRNWRLIVNQGSFDPQPDQLSCDLNLFFPRFSVPVEDGVRKGRSGSGLQLDQKDYQLGMDPFTSDNHIFWGWTSTLPAIFGLWMRVLFQVPDCVNKFWNWCHAWRNHPARTEPPIVWLLLSHPTWTYLKCDIFESRNRGIHNGPFFKF